MLLRLIRYAAEAETGPRRLEGGRLVASELSERPEGPKAPAGVTERFEGVTGTGKEDLRDVAVSEREKAAEGGRTWKEIGSETIRVLNWLRRPPEVGTVEGAVASWRGM
jgi:hypothetical protein